MVNDSNSFNYLPSGFFDQLKIIDDIPFTAREIDVIACVVHMRGSSKIASILDIVPRTADTHIANIKRKIENSTREGIIDFIEKSGKLPIIRKHYKNLLVQVDFIKRLKSISILARNHSPACYFFSPCGNDEKSIVFEIQTHLKLAGIKLTTNIEIEAQESFVEPQHKEHCIYVIFDPLQNNLQTTSSKQEPITLRAIKHAEQFPESCTFLVFDNTKENIPEAIKEVGYIDFLAQENYYSAIFEILKHILPRTNLDNVISAFKEYYQIISVESANSLPLIKQVPEIKNNINTLADKTLKNRKLLIIGVLTIVVGSIIFWYNRIHIREIKEQSQNVEIIQLKLDLYISSYMPEILTGYEKFIGRTKELEQIEKGFAENNIIIITGRGGVGKSSLAIEYGKLQKQKKLIVRYFNASSAPKIDQQYRELAEELKISTILQSTAIVRQMVHAMLANARKPVLFIFDNVDQYDDIKDYVANLPPNVLAIVTAREADLIRGKMSITLREFNHDEARQYMQYSLQNRYLNNETLERLIEISGALPYDLKCISAYLIDNPLKDDKSISKNVDSKIKNQLFQEFAASSEKTKQQAWKILQYAAYLDPDFISMEILDYLFSENKELLSQGIRKLEALSLISIIANTEGQSGIRIHRKLQKSVQYSINNYPKCAMSERAIYDNLLIVLDKLFPIIEFSVNIKWPMATGLVPHIVILLDSKLKVTSNKTKISQANLYFKLAKYYSIANVDFDKAIQYGELSLSLKRNIFTKDHPSIAQSLSIIGNIYRLSGAPLKGLNPLQESLKIREKLYKTEHPDIATSLRDIGCIYIELGDIQNALEYLQKALKIRQHLYKNNHDDIANSLSSIGVVYFYLGNYKESLKYLEASLKMFQILYPKNNPNISLLLSNISYAHRLLGNYTKALECSKEAVTIYKRLYPTGNPNTVNALRNLGAALIEINNLKVALGFLHEALDMSKKFNMGKHFIIALTYYELGRGYFKSKDYKKALEFAEKSLSLNQEIYSKVKNHVEITRSLSSMGDIYKALGNKIKALESYQKAYAMLIELSLTDKPEGQEIHKKIKELSQSI